MESVQEKLKNLKINTSKIIYAARKKAGLTQTELSRLSGECQSNISKYEHGLLVPEAPTYLVMCGVLNINYDAVQIGLIDELKKASFKFIRGAKFKVPKIYKKNPFYNVRYVLPWINYLNRVAGPKESQQVLDSLEIDPVFFVDVDNQIDISFLADLKYEIESRYSDGENIKIEDFLSSDYLTPSTHGLLHYNYTKAKTGVRAVVKYAENINRYSCILTSSISNVTHSSLDLTMKVNEDYLSVMGQREKSYLLWDISQMKPSELKALGFYGSELKKLNVETSKINKGIGCTYHIEAIA